MTNDLKACAKRVLPAGWDAYEDVSDGPTTYKDVAGVHVRIDQHGNATGYKDTCYYLLLHVDADALAEWMHGHDWFTDTQRNDIEQAAQEFMKLNNADFEPMRYYLKVSGENVNHIYVDTDPKASNKWSVTATDEVDVCPKATVIPREELFEITREQYDRLYLTVSMGGDIAKVSEQVRREQRDEGKDQAKILQESLDNFRKAAADLVDAWEGVEESDEKAVGINEAYPFAKDFTEVAQDIMNWGNYDPRTPLEQAIDFIESEDPDSDLSHFRGDSSTIAEKEVLKILIQWRIEETESRHGNERIIEEIDELIEKL